MSTSWASTALEARGLRFVGHSDLGGFGDGSQVIRRGDYLYVAHMRRAGTTILDVADPTRPEVVWQSMPPPNTHTHKVQLGDGLMIVNCEQMPTAPEGHPGRAPAASGPHQAGIQLYDVATDPARPRPLGSLDVGGKGVHRHWYTGGRYAYLCGAAAGFRERMLTIADLADPRAPTVVGRWWLPGLWEAGGEQPTWPEGAVHGMHHPTIHAGRAYGGFLDAGLGILDVSDPAAPRLVSQLTFPGPEGGFVHTAMLLPGRQLLAVTQEQIVPDCQGPPRYARLVDASDERHLRPLSVLPEPQGDFCRRGGRFGPHNLHERRPGGWFDESRLYVTYFNAGLRVYDIADAAHPREVGAYVPAAPPGQPACQVNDVFCDGQLVYISDRLNGGVWILEDATVS
jgi:hypothetical protein